MWEGECVRIPQPEWAAASDQSASYKYGPLSDRFTRDRTESEKERDEGELATNEAINWPRGPKPADAKSSSKEEGNLPFNREAQNRPPIRRSSGPRGERDTWSEPQKKLFWHNRFLVESFGE